jgi:rod shape determining protein RodA
MRRTTNIVQNIDWLLVGFYLLLVFLGLLNIYAAVYNDEHPSIFDSSQKYGHQLLFITGAFVIAICLLFIDGNIFTTFSYPIYLVFMAACIAVIFLGAEVKGSKSWFRIGEFGIQPAEFAKFATCMALAKFLSTLNLKLTDFKTQLVAFAIIIIPFVAILLEQMGCALVYFAFIFVLYREGLHPNYLRIGFAVPLLLIFALLFDKILLISIAAAVCVILFLFMRKKLKNALLLIGVLGVYAGLVYGVDYGFSKFEGHQKTRINVFLGKENDPDSKKKADYNVNQSVIAIGSGGFAGKGYLQGTQTKFDFVPEQSTDFIFCTVGEEWGFLGSSAVLLLFMFFIWRIVYVAERQRSPYSRIYGYGVASILFFHLVVNIGMTIRLMPVIGIPLPFFSYGGSSLWGFTILLFIFIRLDADRLQILR